MTSCLPTLPVLWSSCALACRGHRCTTTEAFWGVIAQCEALPVRVAGMITTAILVLSCTACMSGQGIPSWTSWLLPVHLRWYCRAADLLSMSAPYIGLGTGCKQSFMMAQGLTNRQ